MNTLFKNLNSQNANVIPVPKSSSSAMANYTINGLDFNSHGIDEFRIHHEENQTNSYRESSKAD
jgi:hypothetical protein